MICYGDPPPPCAASFVGENQKGTAGRGRERKRHDDLRQASRQFKRFYDNFRHFMTMSVSLFHWHKTSQNVIHRHKIRHKMSRQFATNVTTIYDIFRPVPFLLSPFGFRRLWESLCKVFRMKGTKAHFQVSVAGVLRGNTIRGNRTRSSERKMALWEGLWEGLWKTSENL